MANSGKRRVLHAGKIRIWHCTAVFFLQVPKKCTDQDLSLLYILLLGTCSKLARKHYFLTLGVCFPHPCSSAGCKFAASRSRLQYYRRIVSFPQPKFDEMRCKLDSTENPRLFEKYPTLPKGGVGYSSNECRFSVESSLQHISSKILL